MAAKNLLARRRLGKAVVVVVELVDRVLALTPQLPNGCWGCLLHAALEDIGVRIERSGDTPVVFKVETVDQWRVPATRIPAGKGVPVEVREDFMTTLLQLPSWKERPVGAYAPGVGGKKADAQLGVDERNVGVAAREDELHALLALDAAEVVVALG